jgi:hypothetical protein
VQVTITRLNRDEFQLTGCTLTTKTLHTFMVNRGRDTFTFYSYHGAKSTQVHNEGQVKYLCEMCIPVLGRFIAFGISTYEERLFTITPEVDGFRITLGQRNPYVS